MKLDRYERAILTTLQSDGRISNRDLAQKVGLSPSPCWRRLRELEQRGVIRGYSAQLDTEQLGFALRAFAHVSLNNHHPETVGQFDDAVRDWPEILECYMTSGDYDYMLKIVVPDMSAFEDFLTARLLQVPAIRAVNTSFVLRSMKDTTALPLD
ncbi:MAG TPA: AsnC family transcriptional regulator [Gammaproteobacteria bacterium]|nr:AsnC family transcriptional regulator [Acidiferrobacteraceae bacterium]HCX88063.1 AsnC family transcriptional regulator [Gammaproteobacteria bacterium]